MQQSGPAQLAPHLPAHPQQQDPACEQQTDDFQKLDGESGKGDPQQSRAENPDQDGSPALFCSQARRCKTDDDRVVARQHEIDHRHLKQRDEPAGGRENLKDASHGPLLPFKKPALYRSRAMLHTIGAYRLKGARLRHGDGTEFAVRHDRVLASTRDGADRSGFHGRRGKRRING